jgi:hypothetical protein
MASVNIQLAGQHRIDRLAKVTRRLPVVRVEPATREGRWTEADMRRLLKHPVSGMKFPSTGSAEWPFDAFTARRLADGSIKRAEDDKKPEEERRPQQRAGSTRSSAPSD